MLDLLVGILHLVVFPGGLFALALGLFLKGCDRRVEARLQRRVGPPLIQPFLDLIKLSPKEVISPASPLEKPRSSSRAVWYPTMEANMAQKPICMAI